MYGSQSIQALLSYDKRQMYGSQSIQALLSYDKRQMYGSQSILTVIPFVSYVNTEHLGPLPNVEL